MHRPENRALNIGVVAGFKASDAALLSFLEDSFARVKIAQYRIPFGAWLPWLYRRIRETGFFTLLGHLSLSAFLRSQRILEKVRGTSLWSKLGASAPSWSSVRSARRTCFSERQVAAFLAESDVLVFLDAVRLSKDFFRKFKIPIVQVVWGASPRYYGDSGTFWAYAAGDTTATGVSLVLRGSSFDKISILETIRIVLGRREDLRTIKIKQVLSLRDILPRAVLKAVQAQVGKEYQEISCRIFRAPTLRTYLSFLKHRSLPRFPAYAFKEVSCKMQEKK